MTTPYQDRLLPAPSLNQGDEHFFDAAAQGKFLIKRCKSCDKFHWYPRAICPFCFSDQVEWTEASGQGVIYSYSVTRRAPSGPYAIAYVTLDEGVSMMTNIVDCDLDAIRIGQRVKVALKPTQNDGPPVPCFTPADSSHEKASA
ncbi:Zn-ribbon domain-containing OB-fold protein [Alcaligenaceae bacterium]|nr:Zn-ribbon domain-containing OB-fold protein [Alcaligenaceae bacterium]